MALGTNSAAAVDSIEFIAKELGYKNQQYLRSYLLEAKLENIVETVKYELDQSKINHPTIITESGRACVASSSMLLFNILETTNFDSHKKQEHNKNDHPLLTNMMQIPGYLTLERTQECLNDLNYLIDFLMS